MDKGQIRNCSGAIHRTCNLCRNAGDIIWTDGKYSALKCRNCGVIWVSPQPNSEKLKNVYSCDYFQKNYLKFEKERKDYFRQRLTEIEDIYSQGQASALRGTEIHPLRILDVGCGVGFFLEVAKEEGWEAEGLETSSFAHSHASRKGLKVYPEELTKLELPTHSYDLITMWDVLAHLVNPGGYLDKIREILRDNGLLVIKTPDHPLRLFNLAKLLSFTGHTRGLLHIPAQIYHFEPKSLSGLLEKLGFKVIKIKKVEEAFKGRWTSSLWKNFFISIFNTTARIFGIGESFIVYAEKGGTI